MKTKQDIRQWATLVVVKAKGGRARVLNHSQRLLWLHGDTYFNHQLKGYPEHSILGIVIRISPKGRRMVQRILVK